MTFKDCLTLYQQNSESIISNAEARFRNHYPEKEDSYTKMRDVTLFHGLLVAIGKLSGLFFGSGKEVKKIEQIADIFNWLIFLNWRLGENITNQRKAYSRLGLLSEAAPKQKPLKDGE